MNMKSFLQHTISAVAAVYDRRDLPGIASAPQVGRDVARRRRCRVTWLALTGRLACGGRTPVWHRSRGCGRRSAPSLPVWVVNNWM